MLRRLIRASLCPVPILTSVALYLLTAGVTPALASCNPNRASQAGGWQDTVIRYISIPTDQSGLATQDASVLGDIFQYDTYVPSGHHASAWVMLQNYINYRCCYAQIGWLEDFSTGTKYREGFTQWTHDATYTTNVFPNDAPPGQTTRYQVFFNKGGFAYWDFYENGNLIDAEPEAFIPTSAYVAGETDDLVDQMPGGTNAPETFSNLGYMQNDSWGSLYGSQLFNPTSDKQYFGAAYNGVNQLRIWDKACAS